MSFGEIRLKYGIDKKYSFKYHQLRNFITTSQNNGALKTNLEKIVTKQSLNKGAVSEFYKFLVSNSVTVEDWESVRSEEHR